MERKEEENVKRKAREMVKIEEKNEEQKEEKKKGRRRKNCPSNSLFTKIEEVESSKTTEKDEVNDGSAEEEKQTSEALQEKIVSMRLLEPIKSFEQEYLIIFGNQQM